MPAALAPCTWLGVLAETVLPRTREEQGDKGQASGGCHGYRPELRLDMRYPQNVNLAPANGSRHARSQPRLPQSRAIVRRFPYRLVNIQETFGKDVRGYGVSVFGVFGTLIVYLPNRVTTLLAGRARSGSRSGFRSHSSFAAPQRSVCSMRGSSVDACVVYPSQGALSSISVRPTGTPTLARRFPLVDYRDDIHQIFQSREVARIAGEERQSLGPSNCRDEQVNRSPSARLAPTYGHGGVQASVGPCRRTVEGVGLQPCLRFLKAMLAASPLRSRSAVACRTAAELSAMVIVETEDSSGRCSSGICSRSIMTDVSSSPRGPGGRQARGSGL